jgi:hypothetical protein
MTKITYISKTVSAKRENCWDFHVVVSWKQLQELSNTRIERHGSMGPGMVNNGAPPLLHTISYEGKGV